MTARHHVLAAAAALIAFTAPATAQGISGVTAPDAKVELVQDGFTFLEGPVGTADGGLYFTDVRTSKVHLLDASGKITTVRENTGSANGLVLTKDGELLAVEMANKRVTKRGRDGTMTTISEGAGGKPYMSPNDLFTDARGGIYFTDPGPRPIVEGRPTFVYYLAPGAKDPIVIDDKVPRPNGLILSRDGKVLIVADSVGDTLFAYDVQPDGSVKGKRAYAKLRDIPAGKESAADGIALDRDGRLYVTAVNGVQVFDAAGQYLGTIAVPKQPSNVAFSGPDKRTLYITAREGLYRVRTLAQGPDRLGK